MTQEQDGRAVGGDFAKNSEGFREMQRLYGRYDHSMIEAVLRARWERIEPNDTQLWGIRRASSTALAYMEIDVMHTFAAIEAAGYQIVATAALSASPAKEGGE
jgi:hypothetical protein